MSSASLSRSMVLCLVVFYQSTFGPSFEKVLVFAFRMEFEHMDIRDSRSSLLAPYCHVCTSFGASLVSRQMSRGHFDVFEAARPRVRSSLGWSLRDLFLSWRLKRHEYSILFSARFGQGWVFLLCQLHQFRWAYTRGEHKHWRWPRKLGKSALLLVMRRPKLLERPGGKVHIVTGYWIIRVTNPQGCHAAAGLLFVSGLEVVVSHQSQVKTIARSLAHCSSSLPERLLPQAAEEMADSGAGCLLPRGKAMRPTYLCLSIRLRDATEPRGLQISRNASVLNGVKIWIQKLTMLATMSGNAYRRKYAKGVSTTGILWNW